MNEGFVVRPCASVPMPHFWGKIFEFSTSCPSSSSFFPYSPHLAFMFIFQTVTHGVLKWSLLLGITAALCIGALGRCFPSGSLGFSLLLWESWEVCPSYTSLVRNQVFSSNTSRSLPGNKGGTMNHSVESQTKELA